MYLITGNTEESRGFIVYNGFSNISSNARRLYNNSASIGTRFTIPLKPPVELQYLEINSTGKLTICELKLIQEERKYPVSTFLYIFETWTNSSFALLTNTFLLLF